MTDLFLDLPGISAEAADVRSTADRLGAAYTRLTSVLDARHGCWGTDDIGKAFENGYVDNAADLRTYCGDSVEGLRDFSDGLVHLAGEFRDLDEDNARRFDALAADELTES